MSELPNQGRLVAIDFGEKRIGIAVCDSERVLASPSELVRRRGDRKAELAEIVSRANSIDAVGIVVGLPKSLDGSENDSTHKIEAEAAALAKLVEIPVVFHDERFTTTQAHGMFRDAGLSTRKTRDRVDSAAAAIILQSYIDS